MATPAAVAASIRRTKIVCTLGPASSDDVTLERMIRAGMDIARFNFSHGSHAVHTQTLKRLRRAADRVGRPVGVLQDLSGPKIRVGVMPNGGVEVPDGKCVWFKAKANGTDPEEDGDILPVEYESLAGDVKKNDRILFDDGNLEAVVLRVKGPAVYVKFVRGGLLKSRKGMNLPGVRISVPSVTDKDLRDLEWGLKNKVDFVALSFVRRAADLDKVRARIEREKYPPLLISKIEKPEAIAQLEEIVIASDGIMVARGDLGVEMDFRSVPVLQKRMIRIANSHDKPVITATQMLESMTMHARPTRAEVSDVSNAIFDGTDAIMLSAETAAGRFPVGTVEAMHGIALETEKFLLSDRGNFGAVTRSHELTGMHDALALGVERIARSLEVRVIVAATHSGKTGRFVASSRPMVPVLGMSPNPRTMRRMTIFWGVIPLPCKDWEHSREVLMQGQRAAKKLGLVGPGDTMVVAIGREYSGEFTGRILMHQLAQKPGQNGSSAKPSARTRKPVQKSAPKKARKKTAKRKA